METSQNSASVVPAPNAAPGRGVLGRWILLLTAILQFVSPALLPFNGSADDPPITPPGFFFSIWGLITTGCLAAALWGFPARRATAAPYRHVQLPLSITQVLFVCWLAAATSAGQRYRLLTLPIFIGMLAGVSVSLAAVQATPGDAGDAATGWLLSAVLGTYAGWSTPAIWLNLASLLSPELLSGDYGTALQASLVGAAVVSVAAGSHLSGGNAGFALAATWALTGVLVSAIKVKLTPVVVTAAAGLVILGGQVIVTRLGW